MVNFFIDRPIFAWVIAIIIMLAGVLAIYSLPVSQYPPIAPPAISITAIYPGASAKTVENTVTQIIEQKMTGLDNLLYFSSTSNSAGMAEITLNFKPGIDPDIAWAKVQNKLDLAKPLLPQIVQDMGLSVAKSTRNFFMIVSVYSEDGSMNQSDLMDYMGSNIENIISRVEGVGEVTVFGSKYAMRIWLDPDKLVNYRMMPSDVASAVRAHNVQVSAGQLGGLPAIEGQRLNVTVNVQDMLQTPEQFGQIPLRMNEDGSVVRLRDVARMELGTESYDFESKYNGKAAGALVIRLASGANAIDTSKAVKAKMDELARYFPKGMRVVYPYETTPFVEVAIKEVVKTLMEAIVLVFLVMLLFLGNLRATLIPTIAVPVVLLGTFAVLSLFGFSINMLTMFAMVLAIGLLVDDAIVVIENVERIMHEEGLSPKEAARKSMTQITGALIGIGLVLSAVFGPMAFFGGSTGIIYRQFSLTIVSAMLLSVLVALILTPALCATMLKPVAKGHEHAETGFFLTRGFFLWFDRTFYRFRDAYERAVGHVISKWVRYAVIYLVITAGTAWIFMQLPTSYLPDEDQGVLLAMIQLPAGSTIEQTRKVAEEVRGYFVTNEKEAVESCMTIVGFSMAGQGQNSAMAFIKLRDWDLRNRPDLKVDAVAGRAMGAFMQRRDAQVFTFAPPAILELGTSKGFDFQLQDRGGLGHEKLMEARNQVLGMASRNPSLFAVRPNGLNDLPEYDVRVNWERAGAQGVSVAAINDTLSTAWGSTYVNDFMNNGRVKRVYMQGDARYRMQPEHLDRWYVRNNRGGMVPFSAFATAEWGYGSPQLERYDSFPSMNILGQAAEGVSSGEAMKAIEDIASKLPKGIGYEWTGLSYQERQASAQATALYAFSVLVIFLCLAALYESWYIPFAILLVLPLGVFGAVLATWGRGMTNDVYFKIGLLTTLGLTAKNAILIAQFAKERMAQGGGLIEATREAARLRLRPIVMTSLAFVLGVLPLALNHGAGAAAQNAIGTGVVGGMLAATFIAIFFIPLFFVGIYKLFHREQTSVSPVSGATGGFGTILKLLPFLLALLCASGCGTLAPKYQRPAMPVPSEMPSVSTSQQEGAVSPGLMEWRSFYTDPNLQRVMDMALGANRDLRAAAMDVERSRAIYGIQKARLLPVVDTTGAYSRERVPASVSGSGHSQTGDVYSVSMGVTSWELDFFGRLQSLRDQALQQYLATEEAQRSVEVSLLAEVAGVYMALGSDRESLRLAELTLEAQEATYNMIAGRVKAGVSSEIDLHQARTRVEAARVEISRFTRQIAFDRNALDLLAGSPVPEELLPQALAPVTAVQDIAAGLKSDILLNRPDIMQAEDLLQAANANIGAARAEFFPRVSLTSNVGTVSGEFSNLFHSGSSAWAFSPQVSLPIFDPGIRKQNLKAAEAERDMLVAQYEKSIQSAFREVSDALATRATIDEQLAAQQSLVQAAEKAYTLADARYKKGVDTYLTVLDAQRSLYASQQVLILTRLARLDNMVTLYKSLGGGAAPEAN
jgi:hydrophobe/amphiphile efflux-1 (HAE1) family protein/NodT family efflux transporter outer membrane factor (OMF) lipoprotein